MNCFTFKKLGWALLVAMAVAAGLLGCDGTYSGGGSSYNSGSSYSGSNSYSGSSSGNEPAGGVFLGWVGTDEVACRQKAISNRYVEYRHDSAGNCYGKNKDNSRVPFPSTSR
ncbi:MAG: hypothetical protein LBC59_05950 [Chitinispirillales bacterium]|jgi:hypothetical protein|nr:hypothetical protein [Chitinispirillales bacterium]